METIATILFQRAKKQDFEIRSESKRVERKQWKLYNAMTFLNEHMTKRKYVFIVKLYYNFFYKIILLYWNMFCTNHLF